MVVIMRVATSLILGLMSFNANSVCVQNNNELTGLVGLDGGNGLVYATTTSVNNECACARVRFRPENTDTDKALSILLSAKMANMKVRIDLLDENNCDSAFRVYIQ